jgi:hypothetical protein
MSDDNKNVEISIVESIGSSNIVGIASDFGEVLLDNVVDAGKEIPVFGVLVKSVDGIIHVREQLYLKKIFRFLAKLGEIPTEKRQKFIKEHFKNEDEKRKFGEARLLMLDSINHMDKAPILACIWKACIEEQIDRDTAEILETMVDRAHLPHLMSLVNSENLTETIKLHLVTVGFFDANILPMDKETGKIYNSFGMVLTQDGLNAKMSGSINDYGRQLVDIIRDNCK